MVGNLTSLQTGILFTPQVLVLRGYFCFLSWTCYQTLCPRCPFISIFTISLC